MTKINGLPAHVLLVHALVVLIPLTAVAVVAAAVRLRWRDRLGSLPVLAAAAVVVLTPLTTSAGEWLQDRVPETARVRRHVDMGEQLLPWAIGLLVIAVAVELVRRDVRQAERLRAGAGHVLVNVLAVIVALGAVVTVVRIGDSGAQAVWHDKALPAAGATR